VERAGFAHAEAQANNSNVKVVVYAYDYVNIAFGITKAIFERFVS
jgi:hypothetical protein